MITDQLMQIIFTFFSLDVTALEVDMVAEQSVFSKAYQMSLI